MAVDTPPKRALQSISVNQQNLQDFVCVRIFGGLGNQMFQYAAGLAQAKRLKAKLMLHIAPQAEIAHGAFGLNAFPLDAVIWDDAPSPRGFHRLLGERVTGLKRRRKTGKHWPGKRFHYDGLAVNDAIHGVEAGTYLSGYFQSEAYFAAESDAVRAAFCLSPLDAMLANNVEAALQGDQPTVSVHIRRGDYLNDPKVRAIHGLTEDAFYLRAKTLMERLYGDCLFLIFSDDVEAADQLTRSWSRRVLVDQGDRFDDLHAMTRCDHHIIANSSFSWWGAWLNASATKTVIAPRFWFTREALKSYYAHDICPQGWVLL